jgi:hypothetical protein
MVGATLWAMSNERLMCSKDLRKGNLPTVRSSRNHDLEHWYWCVYLGLVMCERGAMMWSVGSTRYPPFSSQRWRFSKDIMSETLGNTSS